MPLNQIRVIQIDQEMASAESLLRTRSFRRDQIQQVDVNREIVKRREISYVDLRLTVRLDNGKQFSSPTISYELGDLQGQQHEKFLIDLRTQLLEK